MSNVRLGIGSYTLAWAIGVPGHEPHEPLTASELLDKARALGVRVVQISDNLPLDRVSPADMQFLAARASELEITLEIGTRGVAPEHVRRFIALARRLGAELLRTIPEDSGELQVPETVAALRALVPDLETAGVKLAVENHGRIPVGDLRKVVASVGSPYVGVCLDTVNSFGTAEGPEAALEALAPFTLNLHVKDFAVRRAPHQMGLVVEGRPAGQGQLDIPRVLEALRSAGASPNAILELWTPPQSSLEETIALEDAWARESIQYLRKLIPD